MDKTGQGNDETEMIRQKAFNRARTRSEAFRPGPPDDHEAAVRFVGAFLIYQWFRVFPELETPPRIYAPLNVVFDEAWTVGNKVPYRLHSYDGGAKSDDDEPILIYEIGAIGDNTKHNPGHPSQLIKDGVAERYIEEKFPGCRFYRINKDDAMDEHELAKILWVPGRESGPGDNKEGRRDGS